MTLKTNASEINFRCAIENHPEFSKETNNYKILAALTNELHASIRLLEIELDRVHGEYVLTNKHVQKVKQLYKEYYSDISELIQFKGI